MYLETPFCFGVDQIVTHVYGSAADEDCRSVKIKAH